MSGPGFVVVLWPGLGVPLGGGDSLSGFELGRVGNIVVVVESDSWGSLV